MKYALAVGVMILLMGAQFVAAHPCEDEEEYQLEHEPADDEISIEEMEEKLKQLEAEEAQGKAVEEASSGEQKTKPKGAIWKY